VGKVTGSDTDSDSAQHERRKTIVTEAVDCMEWTEVIMQEGEASTNPSMRDWVNSFDERYRPSVLGFAQYCYTQGAVNAIDVIGKALSLAGGTVEKVSIEEAAMMIAANRAGKVGQA
jgi:hypothetical protein